MVEVSIEGDLVHFDVKGFDKFWALKKRLTIPLAHIRAIQVEPKAARGWWHGLRLMGSNIPGILTAGTFYQQGELVFYDVHDPERTVVLELEHETYKKLIVEVDDPHATRKVIEEAIGNRRP